MQQTDVFFTLYIDGASRGNPGHSGVGFVIVDNKEEIYAKDGKYIGITNSALAEYQALRYGLERAINLGIKKIICKGDNLMVINQMNNLYEISDRNIWPIHERIVELMKLIKVEKFIHIDRNFNRVADSEANAAIDKFIDEFKM